MSILTRGFWLRVAVCAGLGLVPFGAHAARRTEAPAEHTPLRPGRVIVQFTDAARPAVEQAAALRAGPLHTGLAGLDALNDRWRATSTRRVFERPADAGFARTLGLERFRVVEIDPAADPVAAAAEYARDPSVITAEPDWVATPDAVPNDPYYPTNWGHHNTGQLPSWNTATGMFNGPPVGTPGFDSGAQPAWDSPVGYGTANTIVALIDTDGADLQHVDLRFVAGWDFIGNDSNPDDPCTAPGIGCGHGTKCAGLMASIANNGVGTAGIAGGCSIMTFRAAATSEVAAAILAAADSAAGVANMSFTWYGVTSNAAVAAAAMYAAAHDVLMFSSSGNRNDNSVMWMPQVLPQVYAIGSASPCGTRKRSSSIPSELKPDVQPDPAGASCDNERNWGSSWGGNTQGAADALDLIAPVILPAPEVGGGYEPFFTGTSASCAYASGVALLLRSVHPSWTALQIRDRLFATATDIVGGDAAPGWDPRTGWGLIHAGNAVGTPVAEPDLLPNAPPGWDGAIIPRETNDATPTSAPAPTHLTGDGTTYVNVAWKNQGAGAADSTATELRVDGVAVTELPGETLAPGATHAATNVPLVLPGGRHTLEARVDFANRVIESDETNDAAAKSWVWEPAALPADTAVLRDSPPDPTGGASTPGGGPWSNQDGVRITSGSGANVYTAALHADDPAENYDLHLYAATTGPEDGFADGTELATSARAAGALDFLVAPVRDVGAFALDAGLFDADGAGVSPSHVEWHSGATSALGAVLPVSFAAHEMIATGELEIAPGDSGSVAFELTSADSTQPLHLAVFTPGAGYVTLAGAAWTAATTDAPFGQGFTALIVDLPEGAYPFVVFREPGDGTAAAAGTLRMRRTPPDVTPVTPAGAYSPLVPATTSLGTGCEPWTMPAFLRGNHAAYVKYTWRNLGPGSSLPLTASVGFDGDPFDFTDDAQSPGSDVCRLVILGHVGGGRHTLTLRVDVNDVNDEIFRSDDIYGEQWVWGPPTLVNDTPETRPMPPMPSAGQEYTTVGPLFDNVDGLRTPVFSADGADGVLGLAALVPGPGSDVDLVLYDVSTGSKNGFDDDAERIASVTTGDAVELVLVDTDDARGGAAGAWDLGLKNAGGSADCVVETTASRGLPPFLGITTALDSLPAGRVARLIETRMGPAAGPATLRLRNVSGDADLGLAVIPLDGSVFFSRASATVADANGPGGLEDVVVTLAADAPFAIVVFKHGADELAKDAVFELFLGDSTVTATPIVAPAPAATHLRRVAPNPFAPRTTVGVDLASAGETDVVLYDASGRVVRRLLQGPHAAGRYDLDWDGRDETGRSVASGVYFVRFRAAGVDEVRKVTRLK